MHVFSQRDVGYDIQPSAGDDYTPVHPQKQDNHLAELECEESSIEKHDYNSKVYVGKKPVQCLKNEEYLKPNCLLAQHFPSSTSYCVEDYSGDDDSSQLKEATANPNNNFNENIEAKSQPFDAEQQQVSEFYDTVVSMELSQTSDYRSLEMKHGPMNNDGITMVRINTADNSYLCSCGESFLDFRKVGVHLGTHVQNQFLCGNCNMKIRESHLFLQHMRNNHHRGNCHKGLYWCKLCYRKFGLEHELIMHMQCHDGMPQCKFCNKTFSHGRETHLQESLECKANWLGCSIASTLATNHALECAICCTNFTTQKHLLAHSLLHTNGRLCQCSVCNKEYKTFSYLVLHMSVHSHDKPFVCPICNKKFKRRSNLKCHRRMCGHSTNETSSSNALINPLPEGPSDMGDKSLSQFGGSHCTGSNTDTRLPQDSGLLRL